MGCLIVFEGIECSGKSTQIELANEFLNANGIETMITREPGGTPMAETIREVMLRPQDTGEKITGNTELLLAYAAREQHIQDRIIPAIDAGKVVLCDRFSSSSYIYQVLGHGASLSLYQQLEAHIVKACQEPSAYLILDIDPMTSARRMAARSEEPDRIELEGVSFFEKVCAGYRDFAELKNAEKPGLVQFVDAHRSVPEVTAQIRSKITKIVARDMGINLDKTTVPQGAYEL